MVFAGIAALAPTTLTADAFSAAAAAAVVDQLLWLRTPMAAVVLASAAVAVDGAATAMCRAAADLWRSLSVIRNSRAGHRHRFSTESAAVCVRIRAASATCRDDPQSSRPNTRDADNWDDGRRADRLTQEAYGVYGRVHDGNNRKRKE